jgi:hypothetical protein
VTGDDHERCPTLPLRFRRSWTLHVVTSSPSDAVDPAPVDLFPSFRTRVYPLRLHERPLNGFSNLLARGPPISCPQPATCTPPSHRRIGCFQSKYFLLPLFYCCFLRVHNLWTNPVQVYFMAETDEELKHPSLAVIEATSIPSSTSPPTPPPHTTTSPVRPSPQNRLTHHLSTHQQATGPPPNRPSSSAP